LSDIPFSKEELEEAISNVIESRIKPYILSHGGNIQLIDIENENVLVKLEGSCGSCPSSVVTIKNVVEKEIKDFIHPGLNVIHIKD
jgi:NifU-like protein